MSGQVPAIGQPAPDFTVTALVGQSFKEVSLSQYRGSDRVEEFRRINCEVLGVSGDTHFTHLAWTNVDRKSGGIGHINYPLLGDVAHTVGSAYGVHTNKGLSLRGLFIIDDKGILRQITINDFPVGRSVDETLRLVQAFQFTDKHGEVCPAGWKPGSLTIKPDVESSKQYFEKAN